MRFSARWSGKITSRIGRTAGVVVRPGDGLNAVRPGSAHDLRRGFASSLASAGHPRERLQKLMRHADHNTTERYYVEAEAEADADYLARFPAAAETVDEQPAERNTAE